MLGWLVEGEGIEPHIPVFNKSERKDGAYPATDFVYDHEADECVCPGGKALKPYWRAIKKERPAFGKDGFKKYFARKDDCAACVLNPNPLLGESIAFSADWRGRTIANLGGPGPLDALATPCAEIRPQQVLCRVLRVRHHHTSRAGPFSRRCENRGRIQTDSGRQARRRGRCTIEERTGSSHLASQ
jgi:hypothetical protein